MCSNACDASAKLISEARIDFDGNRTLRPLQLLRGHVRGVASLAFHPNEALIASGSGDGTLRLWEVPV